MRDFNMCNVSLSKRKPEVITQMCSVKDSENFPETQKKTLFSESCRSNSTIVTLLQGEGSTNFLKYFDV